MSGKGYWASGYWKSKYWASGYWAGVGVEIVATLPSRYHTLIGPTTEPHLLMGPNTTLYVLPGFSGFFELTN
jgi:hypothetical protein